MKFRFLFPPIAVAMVLLGGCSTTNFYTLEGLTEEAIAELSIPTPTAQMTVLRSKFIAGAVALYGSDRVTAYSGEHTVSDADAILGRLIAVGDRLKTLGNVGPPPTGRVGSLDRIRFIRLALRLVDASTRPTRRYYREKILAALTVPSAVSAIGAAKTAFQAFKKLAEVAVYRRAMIADASYYYLKIMNASGTAVTGTPPDPSTLFKTYKDNQCVDKTKKTLSKQVEDFGKPRPWWSLVPPLLRRLICEGKDRALSEGGANLVEIALKIGERKGPWLPKNTDTVWQEADAKAHELLDEVCKKLSAQAGKTPNTPCFPK